METSGIKDADLACHYIFGDRGHETSPSKYSGSIFLSWSMLTYRGQLCVSRSWETESEQDLNTEHLQEVAKIRKKYGTKKAVEKVWKLLQLK